jgi:hypothetical protein
MNAFLKKIKHFRSKHSHALKIACGSALAVLLLVAVVGSGAPRAVYAWVISVSMSATNPTVGGYTNIWWYAGSAQYCTLSGPTLPCTTYGGLLGAKGGGFGGFSSCSQTFYGSGPGSVNTGNYSTGPVYGPTSYTMSCYSPAGCSWGCNDGSGGSAVTVYPTAPTPSTLTSFTASPAAITGSGRSTLSWTGSRGTYFNTCLVSGGQFGGGTSYSALPGSVQTNVLTAGTYNYSVTCYDTNGATTGARTATVTVTAPLGPCNDIPLQTSVPNGCVAPVPAPGTCVPAGGSYSATSNTCACPVGKHLEGATCVNDPLCKNGLNDSYAPSCTCPAHQYQPGGVSSCLPLPVCANGLGEAYSPSCTCPAGQVQVSGGSTCVLAGVINDLSVAQDRVRKGNDGTVRWSTTSMVSCALRTPAVGGAIDTLSTQLSGSKTLTISHQTVFTLTCADQSGATYSKTATINLTPAVDEE